MSLKTRVDKTFDRYGESFLVNGSTAAKGFFQVLDQNRMNAYFDSIEQSAIQKPALIVMVAAGTVVSTGNTVTHDSRTYTVEKLSKLRVKDTVVMQILLLI